MSNEHNATFEVGPLGQVNDEKVQLVYAAVNRDRPFDFTAFALRSAIEAEARFYSINRDEDQQDKLDERILLRAERFLEFLHCEDEVSA